MQRTRVIQALQAEAEQEEILIKGWIRTKRDSKGFSFLEVNDGSCLQNIQVIVDDDLPGYERIKQLGTGTAISIQGSLVESPGKGQKWEIRARQVQVLGEADPANYPLQKKRHSDEFLRSIAELRPRTNKYGAMNRIRSALAHSIQEYLQEKGFYWIHTPIITASDCEGAGELFQVTTLGEKDLARGGDIYEQDFFGKKAFLTVSGQLAVEAMACSLGNVYTFGPTFRAEDSNTPRHAAEFWMVEPEMAFADLKENIDLAEDLIKNVLQRIQESCFEDLKLFARFVHQGLDGDLHSVIQGEFVRLTYARALEILQGAGKQFEYPVHWGADLQTEHERYLTEEYFAGPVVVYDYPRQIKPFYMRVNADESTVAGMDVLLPRIGELVGGSQREERLDKLSQRMLELGIEPENYEWYLNLRRFGTVPHAGFGLGFDRLLMFATGVYNIRDVLPFPRTPRHLQF